MRRTNWTTGVIMSSLTALAVGATALPSDWPQWRGANRDGNAADFTPPQTWPKALTQKWKTTVGLGDATPALAGDKLYVFARLGNDEVTSCLDAETGKVIWQDKYPATVTVDGAAASHPGPRSSPVVSDGKVVTLDEGATVSCLDVDTGKVAWRKDFSKDLPSAWPKFFTSSSPMLVDGMCIAQLGGQGHGIVIALDLGTGETKWKWEGEGPAYASLALLTVDSAKQVVALTERSVVGISAADGKLAWQMAFGGGGGMGMGRRGGGGGGGGFQRGGPGGPGGGPGGPGGPGGGMGRRGGRGGGMSYNAASPVIDGQSLIVSAPGAGTKSLKIEKSDTGFAAKEQWANTDVTAQFCTPVLKDGRLYGISAMGTFFCLDASTGKTLWTGSDRVGERGFGTIVSAGPLLMALTTASDLIVFKPSDKAYEEVARLKVSDMSSYSYPIVSGNRLFIKDRDSVMSYVMQ